LPSHRTLGLSCFFLCIGLPVRYPINRHRTNDYRVRDIPWVFFAELIQHCKLHAVFPLYLPATAEYTLSWFFSQSLFILRLYAFSVSAAVGSSTVFHSVLIKVLQSLSEFSSFSFIFWRHICRVLYWFLSRYQWICLSNNPLLMSYLSMFSTTVSLVDRQSTLIWIINMYRVGISLFQHWSAIVPNYQQFWHSSHEVFFLQSLRNSPYSSMITKLSPFCAWIIVCMLSVENSVG
jgi:hypothetical protein